MKTLPRILIFGALLILGAALLAQGPVENISSQRHPNLAAAQKLMREAYDKISVAQQDNNYDMEGHAKKAKELLEQASTELKTAAEDADKNKGHK